MVVDTLGLLVVVLVTAASVQDRDGGRLVLDKARMAMPSIVLVWAEGGYAGRCVAFARAVLRITVQIVKKPAGRRTFEVLPRRWVVERTLSWLVRCRRLDTTTNACPPAPKPWSSGPRGRHGAAHCAAVRALAVTPAGFGSPAGQPTGSADDRSWCSRAARRAR